MDVPQFPTSLVIPAVTIYEVFKAQPTTSFANGRQYYPRNIAGIQRQNLDSRFGFQEYFWGEVLSEKITNDQPVSGGDGSGLVAQI
jgi:hypothetical protein